MTTPKIATFHRGGSRFYVHPDTGDKVPGVTSVIGMLPKPFLKWWAAKEVATTAVAMGASGELSAMAQRDPDGAIDYLKRSPDRNTRKAADIGTAAHGVFEALSLGQPLGPLVDDLKPFAAHFADFLDTVQPVYLRTEETVWSTRYSYAGSFDSLLEIQGERCWADNKTTRSGVHAEVALQLAAYRKADFLLDSETGEQILQPEADRGVVIHVRPEGWALYEVPIGDDVFEFFLHLRQTFEWVRSFSKGIPGKPLLKGAAK
jgi:hypothetical protein